jgi:hypothetical protein
MLTAALMLASVKNHPAMNPELAQPLNHHLRKMQEGSFHVNDFAWLRWKRGSRPPLALVMSAGIASVAIWLLIYQVSGRAIWLW